MLIHAFSQYSNVKAACGYINRDRTPNPDNAAVTCTTCINVADAQTLGILPIEEIAAAMGTDLTILAIAVQTFPTDTLYAFLANLTAEARNCLNNL